MKPNATPTTWWTQIQHGFTLACTSIAYMFRNKKLLLFPLFAVLLGLGCCALVDGISYATTGKHVIQHIKTEKKENEPRGPRGRRGIPPQLAFFIMLLYYMSTTIATFCNIGLSHATSGLFNGQAISIRRSLAHSMSKVKTIFAWTGTLLLLHLLIGIIKGDAEKRHKNWARETAGTIVELAWALLTFLIIPVVTHERLSILNSINRSAFLMRSTFGTTITATISFVGMMGLVIAAGFLLIFGGLMAAVMTLPSPAHNPAVLYSLLTYLGIIIAITLFICTVISAAAVVFKTATYHYTLKQATGPFSRADIEGCFTKKEGVTAPAVGPSPAPTTFPASLLTLFSYAGITDLLYNILKGLRMAWHSFLFVKNNKRLLVLGFLSVLSCIVAVGIWVALLITLVYYASTENAPDTANYIIAPITAVSLIFLINFSAALWGVIISNAVISTLETTQPRLWHSFYAGLKRLHVITFWALVGVIVRFVASKSGSKNIAGGFFSFLIGASWSMITYFLYPIIAVTKLGLKDSIKQSIALMKSHFGQTVGAAAGFSLMWELIFFSFLIMTVVGSGIGTFMPYVATALLLVYIILLWMLITIVYTTELAFTAIVFQYSMGKPLGTINRQVVEEALQQTAK